MRRISALLGVLGAYDDLSCVSRFLITNQAELPDGSPEPYAAHEYGALVFVYAHLDDSFLLRTYPRRTRPFAFGSGSTRRTRGRSCRS